MGLSLVARKTSFLQVDSASLRGWATAGDSGQYILSRQLTKENHICLIGLVDNKNHF